MHADDWDDDPYESEAPEDDDDNTIVVRCPSCGADVYEDAEQCPACGDFIVHSTSAWEGRPIWWVLLGLLGIIAVITVLSW